MNQSLMFLNLGHFSLEKKGKFSSDPGFAQIDLHHLWWFAAL